MLSHPVLPALLVLTILMSGLGKGTLFMDRRIDNDGPNCLVLKNPRPDVYALLMMEQKIDRVFIDMCHDTFRWIQIISNDRALFEELRSFDQQGVSKTVYRPFMFPDESVSSRVRAIQIMWPSEGHLFVLLREFQPCLCKILRKRGDRYFKLCFLPRRLEELLFKMYSQEDTQYTMDMNSYLNEKLESRIPSLFTDDDHG